MNEEKDRAGVGTVIYSVGEAEADKGSDEEQVDDEDVQDASEESFPASDSPGYAGGSSSESS